MKLLVYDRTQTRSGLTQSWIAGAALYAGLGRLDAARAVGSWSEALSWLASVRDGEPVTEVQFWGHGRWGRALVDRESLDREALRPGHALHDGLRAVRQRLAPGAFWWFRTCETIGAEPGQRFARELTDLLGCAVAGFTYVIGPLQSGLHRLEPGAAPHWPADEGLLEGTPSSPRRARWSTPWAPNTVSCLHGRIPTGW